MRFDPHLFGKPDLESEKTYQGKPDCKLDPESGKKKFGSGINIPDPQHC
jgi:hypothetical protein